MSFEVFFQVILATKTFPALGTRERTKAAVNPFVSRQFFIPGERFSAVFFITFKGSFS